MNIKNLNKQKTMKNIKGYSLKNSLKKLNKSTPFKSSNAVTKSTFPLIKQWINGVYNYNNNFIKNLPFTDIAAYKLIKNFFKAKLLSQSGKRTRLVLRRISRLSLNTILTSKPEIKHFSDKVNITVFLYNKKKVSLLKKLLTSNKSLLGKFSNRKRKGSGKKRFLSTLPRFWKRKSYKYIQKRIKWNTKRLLIWKHKKQLHNLKLRKKNILKSYIKPITIMIKTKKYKVNKRFTANNKHKKLSFKNVTLKNKLNSKKYKIIKLKHTTYPIRKMSKTLIKKIFNNKILIYKNYKIFNKLFNMHFKKPNLFNKPIVNLNKILGLKKQILNINKKNLYLLREKNKLELELMKINSKLLNKAKLTNQIRKLLKLRANKNLALNIIKKKYKSNNISLKKIYKKLNLLKINSSNFINMLLEKTYAFNVLNNRLNPRYKKHLNKRSFSKKRRLAFKKFNKKTHKGLTFKKHNKNYLKKQNKGLLLNNNYRGLPFRKNYKKSSLKKRGLAFKNYNNKNYNKKNYRGLVLKKNYNKIFYRNLVLKKYLKDNKYNANNLINYTGNSIKKYLNSKIKGKNRILKLKLKNRKYKNIMFKQFIKYININQYSLKNYTDLSIKNKNMENKNPIFINKKIKHKKPINLNKNMKHKKPMNLNKNLKHKNPIVINKSIKILFKSLPFKNAFNKFRLYIINTYILNQVIDLNFNFKLNTSNKKLINHILLTTKKLKKFKKVYKNNTLKKKLYNKKSYRSLGNLSQPVNNLKKNILNSSNKSRYIDSIFNINYRLLKTTYNSLQYNTKFVSSKDYPFKLITSNTKEKLKPNLFINKYNLDKTPAKNINTKKGLIYVLINNNIIKEELTKLKPLNYKRILIYVKGRKLTKYEQKKVQKFFSTYKLTNKLIGNRIINDATAYKNLPLYDYNTKYLKRLIINKKLGYNLEYSLVVDKNQNHKKKLNKINKKTGLKFISKPVNNNIISKKNTININTKKTYLKNKPSVMSIFAEGITKKGYFPKRGQLRYKKVKNFKLVDKFLAKSNNKTNFKKLYKIRNNILIFKKLNRIDTFINKYIYKLLNLNKDNKFSNFALKSNKDLNIKMISINDTPKNNILLKKQGYSLKNNLNLQLFSNYLNKAIIKQIIYSYKFNYLKDILFKQIAQINYLKMLSFNNTLYKSWFLYPLKTLLSKLYNKEVILNFVNIKYLYLSSDLLTQAIVIKLKNIRKNGLYKVLKKVLTLVPITRTNNYISDPFSSKYSYLERYYNNYKNLGNLIFKSSNNKLKYKGLSLKKGVTKNNKKPNFKSIKWLNGIQTDTMNFIKYKSVFGIKLVASGRLTKRSTASRAVFKYRYRGNLRNDHLITREKNPLIIKSNLISNLQYINLNSKTRNGSFGIKTWLNNN